MSIEWGCTCKPQSAVQCVGCIVNELKAKLAKKEKELSDAQLTIKNMRKPK